MSHARAILQETSIRTQNRPHSLHKRNTAFACYCTLPPVTPSAPPVLSIAQARLLRDHVVLRVRGAVPLRCLMLR